MFKKYFSYSPIPFRYFLISGIAFSFILIISSYLAFEDSEYTVYGNLNHSILTFWKYVLWPLFVPGMYVILSEIKRKEGRLIQGVFLGLLALFFAGSHSVVSNVFYYLTLWPIIGGAVLLEQLPQFFEFFIWILLSRFLDAIGIIGILLGINFYQEYSEKKSEILLLKTELREAELTALRNQLNPHFLFNTLNTISSLIDQDTERAQKVLSKVAQLLRNNLDQSKKHIILFKDEIGIVKDYLSIEMERFNDRFTVEYSIDDETLTKKVPNLFLQPLVENALKHGVYKTIHPVTLSLDAKLINGKLIIKVRDDGAVHNTASSKSTKKGVGLRNLESRLERLYNSKASLDIELKEKEFFEVIITIPLEEETHED